MGGTIRSHRARRAYRQLGSGAKTDRTRLADAGLQPPADGGADLALTGPGGQACSDQGGGRGRLVEQPGADQLAEAEGGAI